MEREGRLWRHVGKGTFVAEATSDEPGGALVELGRQLTPFRMMRARQVIEPALAREANVNASGEALRQMQLAMERAHSALNWHDCEIQDDNFQLAIAAASDNMLLLALFDQSNQVRRAVAWGSVTAKHHALHPAILALLNTRRLLRPSLQETLKALMMRCADTCDQSRSAFSVGYRRPVAIVSVEGLIVMGA